MEIIKMEIGQLKARPPFSELFTIDHRVLQAVMKDMAEHGFDQSQPIILWDGEDLIIDGHTRFRAARELALEVVVVYKKSFPDEAAALQYAIHNQRDRRNMTDDEFVRCVEAVHKLREAGRPSKKLASSEANFDKGKSAAKTAKIVGGSRSKVERTLTVLSDPEVAEEVKARKTSINQGAKKVLAKRVKPPKATAPTIERTQAKAAEQDSRQEVLMEAWNELLAWRQKYREYKELSKLFEFLDKNYLSKLMPEQSLQETEVSPPSGELGEPCPCFRNYEAGDEEQEKPNLNDESKTNFSGHAPAGDHDSPSYEVAGPEPKSTDAADPGTPRRVRSEQKICGDCRHFIPPREPGQKGGCKIYPKWIDEPVFCPRKDCVEANEMILGVSGKSEESKTVDKGV